MIDPSHPVATIAKVTAIGWLVLVAGLWLAYRRYVASYPDETVAVGRLHWISHANSTIWLLAGIALALYGVITVPGGPVHGGALVVTLSVAGSILSSANVVALHANDVLEHAGRESPRETVGSVVFWGVGTYGGIALVAVVLRTAPLAAFGPVVLGIVAYAVFEPRLVDLLNETADVPPPLEPRLQQLAADAGFDDVRFRLVLDNTTSNGGAVGIVPGRRTVYLTEPITRELPADELDAIVAHELGHIHERHLEARTIRSAAIWGGYVLGIGGFVAGNVLSVFVVLLAFVGSVVHNSYVVETEFEADAFAADLTDPETFSSALERLTTLNALPRETSRAFELFGEHPSTDRRVDRLLADSDPSAANSA